MTSTQPPTTTFKDRLEADLRASMKARDELVTSTLRMAIAAVRNEEVAGKAARTLTDDEVLPCSSGRRRSAARRRPRSPTPAGPSRPRRSGPRRACSSAYLPAQLSDDELAALVTEALGRRRRHRQAGARPGDEGRATPPSPAGPRAAGSPPRCAASSASDSNAAGRCDVAPARCLCHLGWSTCLRLRG